MGEVDPRIIKRTQETLGKLINKPPLTEKLLNRPPFRFIHDICTSLMRSTGVMKGLFSPDELTAENVKEKDAKIQFLKKIVDFVTVVHNRAPSVRIANIVAGKEADRTNVLLQLLAEAANRGINNADCVAKALSLASQSQGKQEKKEKIADTGKNSDLSRRHNDGDRGSDRRKRNTDASRSQERDESPKVKQTTKTKQKNLDENLKNAPVESKAIEKSPVIEEKKVRKEAEVLDPPKVATVQEPTKPQQQIARRPEESPKPKISPETSTSPVAEPNATSGQLRLSRPTSAKGKRKQKELPCTPEPIEPSEPEKKVSPAQSSKQRASVPPLMKAGDAANQIMDGVGIAPPISGMLVENQVDSDYDENFIVDESLSGVQPQQNKQHMDFSEEPVVETEEHGGLVKKLLQSKRELAGGNLIQSNDTFSKATGNISSGIDDAAKKRERAATEKEMERLSQALQNLTRSALPLGKLVDFFQEDLEYMQMEYKEWKNEDQYLQHQISLINNQTDFDLDPLRDKLMELENKKLDLQQAVATAKSNVLQNDEHIQKMLIQAVERTN